MQAVLKTEEVTVLPDGRMDARNASQYVGLADKTMAMMRCAGEGPEYIKMGKIFYFKDKLDEWIRGKARSLNCQADMRNLVNSPSRTRPQDQSNEEWLSDHCRGKPLPKSATATPINTRRPIAIQSHQAPLYRYLGYSTRKDSLGKGRLVLELADGNTGEIANVYFNVEIQWQRGKQKGHYFPTGDNGRFWVLPKSKFGKFWIHAIGRPEKFSILYKCMGRLKPLQFTGQLDIRPTYRQLLNFKKVSN